MNPQFRVGEEVAVDAREQGGHVRTPRYIRGKRGVVAEICGPHPDPEKLGAGRLGVPFRMLYRVSFEQREVWPDYRGGPGDRLFVDLYEHWLHGPSRS
jgi:nitrile hydratase subunit beta